MTDTLKRPGQEPKRDLSGTTVHIAEFDRSSLQKMHEWPVGEYALKSDATRARGLVAELLDAQFPDPAHKGTRALTEDDLGTLRQALAERLAVPIPGLTRSEVVLPALGREQAEESGLPT